MWCNTWKVQRPNVAALKPLRVISWRYLTGLRLQRVMFESQRNRTVVVRDSKQKIKLIGRRVINKAKLTCRSGNCFLHVIVVTINKDPHCQLPYYQSRIDDRDFLLSITITQYNNLSHFRAYTVIGMDHKHIRNPLELCNYGRFLFDFSQRHNTISSHIKASAAQKPSIEHLYLCIDKFDYTP